MGSQMKTLIQIFDPHYAVSSGVCGRERRRWSHSPLILVGQNAGRQY